MENDVNTILRGEHWKGALQGVSNAVCVMIGTGIGVGQLVNGQVCRGAHGAAGEIGYWLIGALGPIVRPAGYGPLETFAAGPGIARRCWSSAGASPGHRNISSAPRLHHLPEADS